MKAAIYARYSSDLQDEKSIEDQVAACRRWVEAKGGEIVTIFEDRAISGASLRNRPGALAAIESAKSGRYDTLVCEALDRLSRDQEDTAHIYKRLIHSGAEIWTLSEGRIEALHVGLMGTMNALFLQELGRKTRRGLLGVVEEGRSSGGNAYGYSLDRSGPKLGVQTINEQQAAIVCRIFEEYALGDTPAQIAKRLNEDGIPGPGKGGWTSSNILSNRRRRTGILYNELYIGQRVFGKLRYTKDPDTGKRVSKINPESEWVRCPVPELRIVNDELWEAAQQRSDERSNGPSSSHRRRQYLLSGKIKCGTCGANYVVNSRDMLVCSAHKHKGDSICANAKHVNRISIEEYVLDAVRDELLSSENIEKALDEARTEFEILRRQEMEVRSGLLRELKRVNREINRYVAAIGDGIDTPSIREKLAELDNDVRPALESRLAQHPDFAIKLHPNLAMHYHGLAILISTYLKQPASIEREAVSDDAYKGFVDDPERMAELRREAYNVVRSLIDKIEVIPNDPHPPSLLLHGELGSLMRNWDDDLEDDCCRQSMVAGVGFEPTTFRL